MTLLNLTVHLQIIVPTCLLVFGFFVGTLLSYLDPPPTLINFPDFVLQIFQRLLKPIVLFLKL